MKLSQLFYDRDTCQVAQDLLGKYLVRMQNGIPLVVRINETEAYVGPIDKACHAYNYRRTARTETLFDPPGTAYIYLIYGMYHCLNFVTEPEGTPCAVLLRGGEARSGIEQMAWNRYGKSPDELTPYQRKNFLNGPGKLCKALALTKAQNGVSLLGDELYLCDRLEDVGLVTPPEDEQPFSILSGPRVGIDYAEEAVEFPWRYQIEKIIKPTSITGLSLSALNLELQKGLDSIEKEGRTYSVSEVDAILNELMEE